MIFGTYLGYSCSGLTYDSTPRETPCRTSYSGPKIPCCNGATAVFASPAPITAETNLLDEGYLDSLLVMAMVVYIEEQFGVTIDSTEISPRTFRSVRTLAALVAARGAQ